MQPQLSTDYLNRFGEALMLIEMAPMDARSVLAELQSWAIVGYVEHFETLAIALPRRRHCGL